jgi:hypothetical protein
MKFDPSASHIPEKEWVTISKFLEPFETLLTPVADALDMHIRCGKRWPYIELYETRLRTRRAFRLTLNYQYLENSDVFFELIEEQISRPKLFGGRSKTIRCIAKYRQEDMLNTQVVVADIGAQLIAGT